MTTGIENFFPNCNIVRFNSEEEWHKLRGKGIGGSDIATVLGKNKHKTKHQLWLEKAGRVKPENISNEATEKGKRLEPILINLFYGLHFDEVREILDVKSISLARKDKPYMRANLDGAFIDVEGNLTILEIKTSTIRNFEMLDEWGIDEEGHEKIPFNYYCQCLWYMLVTGAKKVILYAMLDIVWGKCPRQETRTAVINYEDVSEDMKYIEENADVFWETIVNGIEPAVVERKYTL